MINNVYDYLVWCKLMVSLCGSIWFKFTRGRQSYLSTISSGKFMGIDGSIIAVIRWPFNQAGSKTVLVIFFMDCGKGGTWTLLRCLQGLIHYLSRDDKCLRRLFLDLALGPGRLLKVGILLEQNWFIVLRCMIKIERIVYWWPIL